MSYRYEIETKYRLGAIVYLKSDIERYPRIIIGFTIRESQVNYILKCCELESEHLQMEIDDNNLGISAN